MKIIRPETVAHCAYDYCYQRIELRLFELQGMQGTRAPALPVVYSPITPENMGQRIEPTARLTEEQAQQLMDGLWDCGIRPTEGKGSAGQLAATQKHLDDMRTLVFHGHNIPPSK